MQRIFFVIHFPTFVLIAAHQTVYAANISADVAPDASNLKRNNNPLPKKIQITPATNSIAHAMYYDSVGKRIEKIGTQRFPKKDGKSLYGSLVILIPVLRDGSLYESEGGPKIERSSGNKQLDMAALEIVRAAALFGRFPSPHDRNVEDEVWELRYPFNFTNENEPHNSPVNSDAEAIPR